MEGDILNELREGDNVLGGGELLPQEPPLWLDRKKWARARELYTKYFASINFGHICGALLLFYFTKVVKTLRSTGNSDSTAALFRRYLATLRHVQSWYEGDVWDEHDPSRKSIGTVRSLHASVAAKMAEIKDGVIYVSQWDMVLGQWGFIAPIILFPSKLGMHRCSEEDFDALVHFWRGIGYLLGIEEKFNLCSGTLSNVIEICRTVEKEFKFKLSEADVSLVAMCQDVTTAFKIIHPALTWGAMSTYIHDMMGVPSFIEMTLVDRICYWLLYFSIINSARIAILRDLMNFHFRWLLDKADEKNGTKRKDDVKPTAHVNSS